MIRVLVPLLVTILMFFSGCALPHTQFTTEDPSITLLIDKIKEYETEQGYPPLNLEDLVPLYLKTIPKPNSVKKIEYSLDKSNGFWVLTYHVNTGTVCNYKAKSNNWGCTAIVKLRP